MAAEALVERLRAAGCVFAEDEAALLLADAPDAAHLETWVRRRSAGEPLEHILGWAEFCGRRVGVTRGVFVPRRRTEFLAAQALDQVPLGGVVVELCCGSAAVATVIAATRPDATVWATDLDPVAVQCARDNLQPHGGQVAQGDLYHALPAELRGRVDVVVANAPYVPSDELGLMPREAREHEPRAALDGGSDGADLHRRIAVGAPEWLTTNGVVLVETSRHRADVTLGALDSAGLPASLLVDAEHGGVVAVGAGRDCPDLLEQFREGCTG